MNLGADFEVKYKDDDNWVATYKKSKRKPKGNLTLGGSDFKNAFEVEPNASKTKQKNIPVLVPKRLT